VWGIEFIVRSLGNYGSGRIDDDDGMKKVGGNGSTLRKPTCCHHKAHMA